MEVRSLMQATVDDDPSADPCATHDAGKRITTGTSPLHCSARVAQLASFSIVTGNPYRSRNKARRLTTWMKFTALCPRTKPASGTLPGELMAIPSI